jgi:hypothetical protein
VINTTAVRGAAAGPSNLGNKRLGGYAFLGIRYWFSVPFRRIFLATVFYVIALIISWT